MPEFEPIIGRYLRISVQGIPYRIYFEEAGSGIPLVCLHTAGSDGQQYRHLAPLIHVQPLCDRAELLAKFRAMER